MDIKTATSIELECLNFYSANAPTESKDELVNYTEIELESILFEEFEQALPGNIYCLV